MSRGQVVVLVAFVAIVGVFAALVIPELDRADRRTPRPPLPSSVDPPAAYPSREPEPIATAPTAALSDVAHGPTRLRVRTADGVAVPAGELRHHGGVSARVDGDVVDVARTAADAWVGAPGRLWAKVPRPTSADPVEVRLAAAAPPLTITVVEDDGKPAADVPVAWAGPDGRPLARRTDAQGRVVVDDQPPGLVVVAVGGTERAGPTLRLRAGTDRDANATLDPPLVVRGRVHDRSGAPIPGARVRGVGPEGLAAGRDVVTGGDGRFAWTGRATDRLSLVVLATDDGRAVAVEPRLPDPLGPLAVDADVEVWVAQGTVDVRVNRRDAGDALVRVRVEPLVLALVREAFGADSVAYEPFERAADGPVVRALGAGFEGLLRVQIDGDVVPEDHVLRPSSDAARSIALAPRVPPPAASDAPAPAAAPSALVGRVVDATGRPLPEVTVIAGRDRVVTAKDGRFRVEGRAAGERVDFLYGWLDGARADPVDPAPFAPWFHGAGRAGGEPADFVLPRAASVSFQATQGLDGRPLSWVRVVVRDGSGEALFDDVRATRAGDVVLEGLAPGTPGSLTLFAPGLRREVPLALRAGETVALGEVALVRGGRVEGVVRDDVGKPVDGASVAMLDEGRGDPADARVRERDLFLRTARTGADGAFAIDGIDPARPALLAFYKPGFAPTQRRAEPDATGFPSVVATLLRGSWLRVRVVDEKNQPLVGAAVELRNARTGTRWLELWRSAAWGGVVGSSDDFVRAGVPLFTEDPSMPGRHVVGPLEPGPYEVVIERPGYKPALSRYSVADTTPGSADNPMRLPLDTMEWRVALEPEPDTTR